MIQVTEDESPRGPDEEEKYPCGVQFLRLPKPVCFAALPNDNASHSSPSPAQTTNTAMSTPLRWGHRGKATSAVVCEKAWKV